MPIGKSSLLMMLPTSRLFLMMHLSANKVTLRLA